MIAYDFSIVALFAALDAQRDARGMSWQQVAREISASFEKCPAKPVSASTLRALCTRELPTQSAASTRPG